jgi:hypothetical protein
LELGLGDFRRGPDWSDDHGGQSDDRIIAQGRHGFQGHVSGSLNGPFVVLFEQDGSDKPDDGVVVWKDADDFGSTLDLAVEPLEGVGGVNLRPVLGGKAHVGEDVALGLVHEAGEFGELRPELVGNPAPLGLGGFGAVLGEGSP